MGDKKRAADEPRYAYTIADDVDKSKADWSGDKFDTDKLAKGRAMMVETYEPDRKAMRYIQDDSLSGFMNPKAGAGRGGQGGPTAKELKAAGKTDSMKSGGKVRSASARADGIATKGKTRGKIVMCGGGMYKK